MNNRLVYAGRETYVVVCSAAMLARLVTIQILVNVTEWQNATENIISYHVHLGQCLLALVKALNSSSI